eukprot:CAMPEP_0115129650 /NCGR_PEP_ID=MMETSP0227-20121206/51926_1 /TAXON_ID=89957 /ORGANISM="Polarella glacialis, Strain CCMP 1383" /LENGTH=62 /DNA_ID=CAMNT_0002534577 /DNA_START=206 /DNA_END=391 /DNA_ORIENTATION=+
MPGILLYNAGLGGQDFEKGRRKLLHIQRQVIVLLHAPAHAKHVHCMTKLMGHRDGVLRCQEL